MSTRSVLSPVRLFLGITYGSISTNVRGNRGFCCPLRVAQAGTPSRNAIEVVLVDIDADVQAVDVAQDDHRLLPGHGRELAGADVDLEDLAVHRRPDHEPVELDLDALDLAPGLGDGRALDLDVFLPGPAFSLARSASALASAARAACMV